MSLNAYPYGQQQAHQIQHQQQQPGGGINPAMLSQPSQPTQPQQSQQPNPTPAQLLAAGGGGMNPQRFMNSNAGMQGMMQGANGMGMGGFGGMNNFASMGNMNGMGGMGAMNMAAMGGMGGMAAGMGGSGGMMNGAVGTINPSAVMNGISGATQPNGMSTINPAMISGGGGVGDGAPSSTIDSNPSSTQHVNPSSLFSHPNFPAQLATMSPQELQLMQEKVMARRQAALAGMGPQNPHGMQPYISQHQHHSPTQPSHSMQQFSQHQLQNQNQSFSQASPTHPQSHHPQQQHLGQQQHSYPHGYGGQNASHTMLPPGGVNNAYTAQITRPGTAMLTPSQSSMRGGGSSNVGTVSGDPSVIAAPAPSTMPPPPRPSTSMSSHGPSAPHTPLQQHAQQMSGSRPGTAAGVAHSPTSQTRRSATPAQRQLSHPPSRPQTAMSNHATQGQPQPLTPTSAHSHQGQSQAQAAGSPMHSPAAGAPGMLHRASSSMSMHSAQANYDNAQNAQQQAQSMQQQQHHQQHQAQMSQMSQMQLGAMGGMNGMAGVPGGGMGGMGGMSGAGGMAGLGGIGGMSGMGGMGGQMPLGMGGMGMKYQNQMGGGAVAGMMQSPAISRQNSMMQPGQQQHLQPQQMDNQHMQGMQQAGMQQHSPQRLSQVSGMGHGQQPQMAQSPTPGMGGMVVGVSGGMGMGMNMMNGAAGVDLQSLGAMGGAGIPRSPSRGPQQQQMSLGQPGATGANATAMGMGNMGMGMPGMPGMGMGGAGPGMGMPTNQMQLQQMQAMQERKLAIQQQQQAAAQAQAQGQAPPAVHGAPPLGQMPMQQPRPHPHQTQHGVLQQQQMAQMQPHSPFQHMQTPTRPGTAASGRGGSIPPTMGTPGAPGMTPAPMTPGRPLTAAGHGTPTPAPAQAVGQSGHQSIVPGGNMAPMPLAASAAAAASAAGSAQSMIPGHNLPPLPANVHLNPAITRITAVPLSQSRTLIPPLSSDEISEIKQWMEVDREYEARFRAMRDRGKAEVMRMHGGRPQWWERDPEVDNAVMQRKGKAKFELVYPHNMSKESSRRRGKRREGLKVPGKLKPAEANRPEQLVPIRLEFDVEHHKYRDTFVWNLNDPLVTPEVFAQSVIDDYGLSSSYHSVITKSIQEQLSDYKAHTATLADLDDNAVDETAEVRKGILEGEELLWWESWCKRLRASDGSVKTSAMLKLMRGSPVKDKKRKKRTSETYPCTDRKDGAVDVDMIEVDDDKMHEEMRISIRLDVTVGSQKLEDQFEWDIENTDVTPEQFAEVYCDDLGLAGEYKTAVAHSIREQIFTYQKSLFLVGHPSDGSAVQDDDLRMSFLPMVASTSRSIDQAVAWQPIIGYLSDGELDRLDKEREKELNRRRKRNTRGRRGIALPDREPLKIHRTPANGIPEVDPTTLALAAAAAAPTAKRAAAAAASLTITNMIASENGTAVMTPSAPIIAQAPLVPISKIPKAKGLSKAPSYPSTILRTRANTTSAPPSTAADASTFEPPLEGDAPLPAPDSRASKIMTARRQRELEKEAKEREFVDGQHANMIDGVWHCSNCGCPDNIAIGRRKGPLGDKSQCGACGKFWHRHRRPRPVEYHTDAEYHINLKNEAERVKATAKKRGGAAARQALAQQEQTPAPTGGDRESTPPAKVEVWVDVSPRKRSGPPPTSNEANELERPLSPASSVTSTGSERPLAQTVPKVNGVTHKASTPLATPNVASVEPHPPPPRPESPVPVVKEPTPPPQTTPQPPQAPPSSTSTANTPTPVPETRTAPNVNLPPAAQRPQWMDDAVAEMQARYPDDKFDIILRRVAPGQPFEWRVKCLDCPGKLYTPGPGETLSNYEVHLRNRQHRSKVQARVNGTS